MKCYAVLHLNFQRDAKLVFHTSQVVRVKCYALLRLKILQRYLKLALSRLTGRESEILCFITFLILKDIWGWLLTDC